MKKKYISLLFTIGFCLFLSDCSSNPTLDELDGIVDANYTVVSVDKSKKPYFLTVKFKPTFTMPSGGDENSYILSLVIDKSNTLGSDVKYFDHETSFISFNVIDFTTKEMYVNGTSFSYCTAPCSYFINTVTDTDGNNIISSDAVRIVANHFNLNTLIKHKTKLSAVDSTVKLLCDDGTQDCAEDKKWVTIKIGIDPLHQGENWTLRHGFPGQQKDEYLILYPFYRAAFSI